MLPVNLKAEQFAAYPQLARGLVVGHLAEIQKLPLGFVPNLLGAIIDYDYKFPAERALIDWELMNLSRLSPAQRSEWFQGFAQLTLSPALEEFDWVNQPAQFVERQSAYLWSTHQLDAFRVAATEYGDRLRTGMPSEAMPVRRLGIAIVGLGVASYEAPLFRNLRPHGTYFGKLKPDNGVDQLLQGVAARAKAHPVPYGHWYVDGGLEADHSGQLTCLSYKGMEPVRAAVLKNIEAELQRPGMGPEELRTHMARLQPTDLGMNKDGDPVLDRFQLKLLTEGSGTQIFSTTYAQWAAREVLRRAQALTLLVRFAPRQRQRPMNEMLSSARGDADVDPVGSLVDAEMAAYYQWINQQRLPGTENSAFLVWFEGHGDAVAIGPSMPRGTQSNSAISLAELLSMLTS